jgi:hypothetical protein
MIGGFFVRGLESYVLACLKRPILVVAGNSFALLALAAITVLTGQLETQANGGVEWLVKADVSTRRWFGAQRVSTKASEWWDVGDAAPGSAGEGLRSEAAYPITFVYSTSGENVFVPDTLESMRKVPLTQQTRSFHFRSLWYNNNNTNLSVNKNNIVLREGPVLCGPGPYNMPTTECSHT